jgi:hypothetical protein
MRTDHPFRLLPWMTIFFIAMAFLESAVVVYLRALYYPEGFRFPLVPMHPALVATEMGRELATMAMLLAPAALVTRRALERFAWFCVGFGIWDIFYYVWLKVLLDWPASLAEPDLLFLLPLPWVGPVWAPCLIAVGLIALGLMIHWRRSTDRGYRLGRLTWGLLITGALIMIASFVAIPFGRSTGQQPEEADRPGLSASLGVSEDDFSTVWYSVGMAVAAAGMYRIAPKRGVLLKK